MPERDASAGRIEIDEPHFPSMRTYPLHRRVSLNARQKPLSRFPVFLRHCPVSRRQLIKRLLSSPKAQRLLMHAAPGFPTLAAHLIECLHELTVNLTFWAI